MKRGSVWLFFGLAFGLTWGIGLLYALLGPRFVALFGPLNLRNPMFYLAVWSPTISAVVLAAAQGRAGLTDLFGRLFRFSIGWQCYVLPVAGFAALGLGARALSAQFGGPPLSAAFASPDGQSWLAAAVTMLVLDPGPLGEEPGWRGYALPRLERRWSGLVASILLGAIWAVWHLPAFLISSLPQSGFGFPLFFLQSIVLGVLMAWMVNNARGSVVPAILAHWAVNRFLGFDARAMPFTLAVFALAAVLVVLFAGRDLGRARMPAPP